jgi:hypothetical protein
VFFCIPVVLQPARRTCTTRPASMFTGKHSSWSRGSNEAQLGGTERLGMSPFLLVCVTCAGDQVAGGPDVSARLVAFCLVNCMASML